MIKPFFPREAATSVRKVQVSFHHTEVTSVGLFIVIFIVIAVRYCWSWCFCCCHSWCILVFTYRHTSYLSRAPRVYPCKNFLPGVNFYRFNAINWHFRQICREKMAVFFTDLMQKIGVFQCKFYSPKILPVKKNDKYQVCTLIFQPGATSHDHHLPRIWVPDPWSFCFLLIQV